VARYSRAGRGEVCPSREDGEGDEQRGVGRGLELSWMAGQMSEGMAEWAGDVAWAAVVLVWRGGRCGERRRVGGLGLKRMGGAG